MLTLLLRATLALGAALASVTLYDAYAVRRTPPRRRRTPRRTPASPIPRPPHPHPSQSVCTPT